MNPTPPQQNTPLPDDNQAPGKLPYTPEQLAQKRRLIRWVIVVCACFIPLSVWLQGSLLGHEATLPTEQQHTSSSALLNLNVLLVLFVLFLVLRNLAELLFERRINRLGSKLKTKLIVSFLSLTLTPDHPPLLRLAAIRLDQHGVLVQHQHRELAPGIAQAGPIPAPRDRRTGRPDERRGSKPGCGSWS